jgi:hypothetical protein
MAQNYKYQGNFLDSHGWLTRLVLPLEYKWSPLSQVHVPDGEHLLDLILGKPLSLVKQLPSIYNSIKLYVLLVGVIHLSIHDLVHYRFLNVVRVELCTQGLRSKRLECRERRRLTSTSAIKFTNTLSLQ